MKTYLLTIIMSLSFIHGYSQWTQSGSNITTTNNVGVGTAAPVSKLEVQSSGAIHSVKPSLKIKDLTNRGTLFIESSTNQPSDMVFKSNNRFSWLISSRASDNSYSLYVYPSVNGTSWSSQALVLKTNGYMGVGTVSPRGKLDVNGDIYLNGNMLVGKQIEPQNGGTVERITIIPYRHTGGPWYIASRDTPTEAFMDIRYNTRKLLSFKYNTGIGILTENPQYALDVNGTIRAKEIKVEITAGADHVFSSNYRLKPLDELETFIEANRHLPEIPTEKQMQENGLNINEFQVKLLQKIEELTLYVIAQDKKIQELETLIKDTP